MSKIKFHKEKDSLLDTIHIVIEYEGGDGDTNHPEEFPYKFKYSEWQDNIDEINKDIENYKLLKSILDINHKNYLTDYKKVKNKHGDLIAGLFDNAPNDPQNDYNDKCYISRVILRGYDEKGIMYETYDLL